MEVGETGAHKYASVCLSPLPAQEVTLAQDALSLPLAALFPVKDGKKA